MKYSKHIVWLTPGFSQSEADDFTIPPLQNLLLEFKKTYPDIKITVISLHFPYKRGDYTWNGLNIYSLGGNNISFPTRFLLWKRAITKLKEIHGKQKIDLVHSFWYNEPALLAAWFCKKQKINHLNTLMGQDVFPNNRYLKLLRSFSIKNVALSKRSATQFTTTTRIPVDAIIPFGIENFNLSHPLARTIDIIGVGNLIPVKNFSRFIQIIATVKKQHPHVKVSIVGDGIELDKLKKMSDDQGLESTITFHGRKSRAETLHLMSQSKILLHTAHYESYGYIFPEATACGCYIVSTPVGMIESTTFSFLDTDNNQLASTIIKLLNINLNHSPRKTTSAQQTVEMYLRLYSNLSEKTGSASTLQTPQHEADKS